MNPFVHHMIIESVRAYYRRHPERQDRNFRAIRRAREIEIELTHELFRFMFLVVGVSSAAFGLSGFLIPNGFIDGGVVGISLLMHEITKVDVALLVVLFNAPFIFLGFRTIGRRFALKSIGAILLLSIFIYVIPFPVITEDKLLIAVFGGFFLGVGIGAAIRGGAIIDGTEVLAIYVSRKSSLTVGNIILIFNLIIFSVAAYVLTIEVALYAILTYFAAASTVDFIIDGIEEFTAVTIVSEHHDEVRKMITTKLGRGCTIIKGQKGLNRPGGSPIETNVLYTIMTRLEIAELMTELDIIDPKAFVVFSSVKDVRGGMIKKKPIKMISK